MWETDSAVDNKIKDKIVLLITIVNADSAVDNNGEDKIVLLVAIVKAE